MKKLLIKTASSLLFFLGILSISKGDAYAVACTEPTPSGDYAVAADCSFARAGVDGVDNGNITINTNVSLTITSGQTVAWNSGKSITISSGASIQNAGGSLFQTDIYAVDEDADGYGKSTTASSTDYPEFYTASGANRVRVNTLTQRDTSYGDCQDTDAATYTCYSYSQSAYYRYAQDAYYRYAQDAYYRYAQSAYYRYAQSTYYRYAQSTYYRYSQGSYYRYAQAYYSTCFTGEMKVAMADGTYKAIKDIKPGDIVLSYDIKSGKKSQETVTKLLVHPNTPGGYLVINGQLEVTPNHMVWSPTKNAWVGIGTLKIGDTLLNSNGDKIQIATIDKVEGTNTVYNLSLSGPNNNFFTEDFLVHNHKVTMAR